MGCLFLESVIFNLGMNSGWFQYKQEYSELAWKNMSNLLHSVIDVIYKY